VLKVAKEVIDIQLVANDAAGKVKSAALTGFPTRTDWDKYNETEESLKYMTDTIDRLKKAAERRIRDLEQDHKNLMEMANEMTNEEEKKAMISEIEGTLYNFKQVLEAKKLIGKEDPKTDPQQQMPDGAMAGPGGPGQPGPHGQTHHDPSHMPSAGSHPEAGGVDSDEAGNGAKKHSSKKSSKKSKGKDKKKHGRHDKKGGKDKRGKNRGRSRRKNKKNNDRGKKRH